jgi:hypothetical protein
MCFAQQQQQQCVERPMRSSSSKLSFCCAAAAAAAAVTLQALGGKAGVCLCSTKGHIGVFDCAQDRVADVVLAAC